MKTYLAQAILISVLACIGALAVFFLHPQAPSLYLVEEPLRSDEVSIKDIETRWMGKVIWLDARPGDQFKEAHIPDAKLLNEQGFDDQLLEMLDVLQVTTKPIIIYCGGQKCEASRHVREKLLAMVAIENCYILKGGWPAWVASQKM